LRYDVFESTLDNAYDALINSISDVAQDHLGIANAISSQIIEVLRTLEKRNDEAKKKVCQVVGLESQDLTLMPHRNCNSSTKS